MFGRSGHSIHLIHHLLSFYNYIITTCYISRGYWQARPKQKIDEQLWSLPNTPTTLHHHIIGLHNGTRQCALGPILRPEILTLVSVVQSLSVLPFFTSAGPQEFNSDIGSRNRTRQRALRPILRPNFFSTETHMVTSTDPLEVKYQVSNHKWSIWGVGPLGPL